MQWIGTSKYINFFILLRFQNLWNVIKKNFNYEMFIKMFPMIFQSLMGLGKSRCDIPSGTTQR